MNGRLNRRTLLSRVAPCRRRRWRWAGSVDSARRKTWKCCGGASRKPTASNAGWMTRFSASLSKPNPDQRATARQRRSGRRIHPCRRSGRARARRPVPVERHLSRCRASGADSCNRSTASLAHTSKGFGATSHSVFEGKQYRVGFYRLGFGMAYNKPLLERAGTNPDDPPRTWDSFLNACDRLRRAGIIPFVGGTSDGYWGDWFLTSALPHNSTAPPKRYSFSLATSIGASRVITITGYASKSCRGTASSIPTFTTSACTTHCACSMTARPVSAWALPPGCHSTGPVGRRRCRLHGHAGLWPGQNGRSTDHRQARLRHSGARQRPGHRGTLSGVHAQQRTLAGDVDSRIRFRPTRRSTRASSTSR